MSEKYWVTGVQLGMLRTVKTSLATRVDIVEEIIDKQFLGTKDKLVPVRLASESVDLQFLEELLIKHIKRTDRFLRKDKRKVKDNFVFGKRYMAKKILSAIHTEMNKAEKEAKKK